MKTFIAVVACATILAMPAALAQGKPGGAQGKPPAGAPQAVERQRDQERDREREDERERDRQREEQRNQEQQERQKTCQQEAQNRELKGDQHQRFMQECMGRTPETGRPEDQGGKGQGNE